LLTTLDRKLEVFFGGMSIICNQKLKRENQI